MIIKLDCHGEVPSLGPDMEQPLGGEQSVLFPSLLFSRLKLDRQLAVSYLISESQLIYLISQKYRLILLLFLTLFKIAVKYLCH